MLSIAGMTAGGKSIHRANLSINHLVFSLITNIWCSISNDLHHHFGKGNYSQETFHNLLAFHIYSDANGCNGIPIIILKGPSKLTVHIKILL